MAVEIFSAPASSFSDALSLHAKINSSPCRAMRGIVDPEVGQPD